VCAAVQLRPDLGAPGRLDLVGPLRRGAALRRDGLRPGPAGSRGRGHHLVRGRAQGDGPVHDVGAAQRDRAAGGARAAAAGRAAATASGGLAGLPAKPRDAHASGRSARCQGAGRTPDACDAVRAAGDGRQRRGRRLVSGPGAGGAGHVRRSGTAGPRRRGRRRPDAGARRRGHGCGGVGLDRQRRDARGLEPGLDRLGARLPRRGRAGRLRAMDPRRAGLRERLERDRGARRPRLPADRHRAAAGAQRAQRPADDDRLPHGQGLEVWHRRTRLARGRPQAVLGRVLLGAGSVAERDGREPALVRAGRQPLLAGR
jgi:hypothetical protein